MSDEKQVTEYKGQWPDILKIEENKTEKEEIRIFEKNRRREIFKILDAYWRFAALAAAFAAIFFVFYAMFFDKEVPLVNEETMSPQSTDTTLREDTPLQNLEAFAPVEFFTPNLIDEARAAINIDEYFGGDNGSGTVFKTDGDVKVLVIHAHSSERVSQSLTALDAGEVVVGLLASAGIGAVHCTVSHDESGRIGAYNRMKNTVVGLKEEYPELVLIIDLHGSENDKPVLFDIGVSSEYAWKENLRIVSAICKNMNRSDIAVRLLPQNLGQDNGIITLNVSLGHVDAEDSFARELIADLALGIITLFEENTPA